MVCAIYKKIANNRETCSNVCVFEQIKYKIWKLQNAQQEQHNENLIEWRTEVEWDAAGVVPGIILEE